MKRTWFELADVVRMSGRDRNAVGYWIRQTVVVPEKSSCSSGDRRHFSLINVIECALAGALTSNGLTVLQLRSIFANLRATLAPLAPELRASALFIRYVEMCDAIAAITGPDPTYEHWRRDAEAAMATWKKRKQLLSDGQILRLLSQRRVEPTVAEQQGAR